MLGRSLLPGAGVRRRAVFFGASLSLTVAGAVGGCLSRPIAPVDSRTTSTVVLKATNSTVQKIDLLFVVDNSSSMADKQKILSLAVPDLIGGLLNPRCVDATGAAAKSQPQGPLDPCPSGSDREFPVVTDIHIGLLSSSLGTWGTPGCPESIPSNDDHGELVTRQSPTSTATVPTYQNLGFLAWDPNQTLNPPGEGSLANLQTSLLNLVVGDGQAGCGYESQNESWYRFLVDPTPAADFDWDAGNYWETASGTDQKLLQQRTAFLRPDSLLAIIDVTDETDTSVKESAYYPLITDEQYPPHARSDCKKGPTDPCCSSCGLPDPPNCAPDPACKTSPWFSAADDNLQLHGFGLTTHKQRYGIEFFYPPSRYVAGLTADTVPDRNGTMVPNPLYTVLDPTTGATSVRDKTLVFYAAITGVPWQLIARQKNGQPDLVGGVSAVDKTAVGGFKSGAELDLDDGHGHSYWDDIVGDPEHYVAPISPFMQEATAPRTGVDPITGINISPPTGATTNAINGGDRPIVPPGTPAGDIEYACTFPKAMADWTDCKDGGPDCDCGPGVLDGNPICGPNPADVDPSTGVERPSLQVGVKAYPGLKNLAIAKGMGAQGIAASICPSQLTTPNNPDGSPAADYGYRPAVNAIIERLKTVIGNQCLPQQLVPVNGEVPCLVLEARNTGGAACTCTGAARQAVTEQHKPAIQEVVAQDLSTANDCFCEVTPITGADIGKCQQDDETGDVNGWCYVDATENAPLIAAKCPASQPQQVHFVGAGKPAANATDFIICSSNGT